MATGVNDIGSGGGGMMVYGGSQGGVGNADLIYAASGVNVLVQTSGGGGFTTTSPGSGTILGVTDDPTDYANVFAIDGNQVFMSTNTGTAWSDVTTNLTGISAADFHSIEYVHGTLDDALVVGSSSGVFYTLVSALGGMSSWSEFGSNLPDVITYDLEYDSADNVLVAGTMGRGAWLVDGVTYKLGIDTAPDLVASGAALSGTDLDFSVDNNGTAAAGASTTGIYLSADATIDTGDTQVGSTSTPALGIGASDGESSPLLSLMFPTNLTPGTYYLGAVADNGNAITETNEANNASNGVPVILGNDSANTLDGTGSADWIIGLGGDDSLSGNNGNDVLLGGDGNDTFVGGAGGDLFGGGAGTDRAQYNDVTPGVNNIVATGVTADLQIAANNTGIAAGDSYFSIEDLYGSNFDDSLSGNGGANHIWGADGNDIVLGRNGNDSLYGMNGDDTLLGGGGGDLLNGGGGIDRAQYLDAPAGVTADLQSPAGNTGYAAGDSYVGIEDLYGSSFDDTLYGNGGANHIWGADGNDILLARGGNDSLFGLNGDDTLLGGAGGDFLNGGAGTDRAQYLDAAAGVTADLQSPAGNTGFAAGDSYASIEDLYGSNFNDILRGNGGANHIWGADGNDLIFGRGGNDSVFGLNGNDTLVGGAGGDFLNGGSGTDRAQYNDAAAGLTADLQNAASNTGDAAGDSYVSIEDLFGSNFGDTLRGNAGANNILGANGNDVILGRDGEDSLSGGNGSDIIIGQAGRDFLYGNAGNDTFVYQDIADSATNYLRDQIRDFSPGADVINLLNIDANTIAGGNQAFSFIGYSVFHGVAGELNATVSSGNSVVAGDVNGDGNADFSILVAGVTNLQASDFFL